MANNAFRGLLMRVRGSGAAGLAAAMPSSVRLGAAGVSLKLEPLFATDALSDGVGLAAGENAHWFLARAADEDVELHPWEAAYETMSRDVGLGAAGNAVVDIVEPDLQQQWLHESPGERARAEGLGVAGGFDDQNSKLPRQPGVFAWHLTDEFSQLRRARQAAAAAGANGIRIVHLDTGYDPGHSTFPAPQVDLHIQRNFVENNNDARDPGNTGLLRNPGHGTGTLSILAGGSFKFSESGYNFDDVLGGAPGARIVPVRVGNSVVQFRTSSVARAISYAAELCDDPNTRADVISMSMGGVASAAWADAVNKAYEAGIVFVAAAGNNFSGAPTRFIVYPARFRRVIAACGVMANRKPYWGLGLGVMQGNWGPRSKMDTAVAAFTPNISWAEIGATKIVDMDGQGTSSATPQVAAAAALYLQAHAKTLFDRSKYPKGWMRVEAVRQALFSKADNSADGGSRDKLGRGILKAAAALDAAPPESGNDLKATKRDSAAFAFLRAVTGLGAAASPIDRMLALEATQLSQRWPLDKGPNPFDAAVKDPDRDNGAVTPAEQRRFLEAILEHPEASGQLRRRADEMRSALSGAGGRRMPSPRKPSQPAIDADARPAGGAGAEYPSRPRFEPPKPAFRSLRGFAFDPSLCTSLDTVGISEVQFNVPWEELQPGPVGEYLEVIDVDPASRCLYEPVDLDDPRVLAQDGLPPSEGTPQFHQQMVYAVASLTIDNFEHALGRRVLWRPGPSRDPENRFDDSYYIQRLRIYPHVLREANAYYSPQKVALQFGYFTASDDDPGDHLPGAHVFTCLSHDIIAHETTHALLDGMHRPFLVASNPDVRAFHEAFADIVALFQHFTFPEILRHQIAATRGQIRTQESLLGSLAKQFGRATGRRGALREAIGATVNGQWVPHEAKPNEYLNAKAPHDRGAFLVAAVFDAFISIYERRVNDLLRLATRGTGVLEPGAIHPDLVNRLADEAAKAAQHVLTMCIRALDYCPPTDITFGEYLRAIITADYDLVRDDDLNYRIAFIEAFRRRGIYPRDVRTLSVESLMWRGPRNSDPPPSGGMREALEQLRPFATQYMYAQTRQKVFELQREMRFTLHGWLQQHFASGSDGEQDAKFLGIDPTGTFEVHSARIALRTSPDGGVEPQLITGLIQRADVPVDPKDAAGDRMMFEGGCTIVAELRGLNICYCIRKNMASPARLERQQEFALSQQESTRDTYFDGRKGGDDDEPFALLHRGL